MTPANEIQKMLSNVSDAKTQTKCPLQMFLTDGKFYNTQFYQLRCRYMPCNGCVPGPESSKCWECLRDESNGHPLQEKVLCNPNQPSKCPVAFYRNLDSKFRISCIGEQDFWADYLGPYLKGVCSSQNNCMKCRNPNANKCWERLYRLKLDGREYGE